MPKEQAFFHGLVRLQEEAEVAYTRFVSVSVDPPARILRVDDSFVSTMSPPVGPGVQRYSGSP